MIVEHNRNNIAYMFNPLECFTQMVAAYILSVDTYNGKPELEIKQDDFGDAVFEILKRNLSQP
jgi:hypothetical protein